MLHDPLSDPASATVRNPTIAGLDVHEVIASGGQGTVYKARDLHHDRLVAVKVLHATSAADTSARQIFDHERLALGRVSDHPGIVSLLDSGYTAQGSPYLVMEYVPGGSLADYLESGPIGFAEATGIIVALSAAIERAHKSGIVHRDIKPDNILRSSYGTWMLTDFGIAALVDRIKPSKTIYATYAHTPPDTFTGSPATPAGDVYSLASVLATCLTGAEPFAAAPGEASTAAMMRIVSQPYPPVKGPDIPHALSELLAMALHKDPSQRPVSARAFGVALNDIRQRHGLAPVALRMGDEISTSATCEMSDQDVAMATALMGNGLMGSQTTTAARTKPRQSRRRRAAGLMAAGFLSLAVIGFDQLPSSDAQTTPATTAEQTTPEAVVFDTASGEGPQNSNAVSGPTTADEDPADEQTGRNGRGNRGRN